MTAVTTIRRAELAHAAEYPQIVVGHQVSSGRVSSRGVPDRSALARFLDEVTGTASSATAWLALRALGYTPRTLPIEFPPSQFQFAVDAAHHIAAAAVLVVDHDGTSHQWLSQGATEHGDALLVADPWNPVTRFPGESAITFAELRRAAVQWAFGEVLPPPAIRWRYAPENEIGWI